MVDLTTVKLWSDVEQALVPFDVALVDEQDDDEGQLVRTHSILLVSRGDEQHRFSPNTTDAELLRHVAEMNGAHSG